MTIRQRKLAGVVAIVVYLVLYCLAAMTLGGAFIVGRSRALELVYFVVAGIAWLPLAMVIIRWMSRPDAARRL
ncbi:MAG: DUF2842 domain-containing protein [Hyphomicrobiales bacterium]